jgi:hypothetical protein
MIHFPQETQTRRASISKAPEYWLREDDDGDLIDTGGITIPAPPETSPVTVSTGTGVRDSDTLLVVLKTKEVSIVQT